MLRRHGFSLIEMLIVVVLIGIISLMGYPKVSSALAKNNLRSARIEIANAFNKARTTAVGNNRRTWVNFTGNNVYVTAAPRTVAPIGVNTLDTIGTVERMDVVYGVRVTADVPSLAYDPRGFALTLGATRKFIVTKGGKRDSVMVNGLGRIFK